MKCPFCNEEMQKGTLASGRYILWKAADERGKMQEYLLAKNYMSGARLEGEICPYCHKLILDVPEMG